MHKGRKRETKQDESQSEKDTQKETMMEGMMGCMGTRKKQEGEKGKGRWDGWRRVENESRKGSKREAKEVKGAENQGKGYDQGKCKEKPCTLCHEGWWSLSQHSYHTHAKTVCMVYFYGFKEVFLLTPIIQLHAHQSYSTCHIILYTYHRAHLLHPQ